MRTIKFRGFNAKNNQWLYGSHIINRGKHFVAPDEFADDKTWEDYEVEPETIGQFTGLVDLKGVDIYEGDILRVEEYRNKRFGDLVHRMQAKVNSLPLKKLKGDLMCRYESPVCWEEGAFVLSTNGKDNDMFLSCLFGDMRKSHPIFIFEVIGNIYKK